MTLAKRKRPTRIARTAAAPYRIDFSARAHLDDWEEDEAVTAIKAEILHVPDDVTETRVGTLCGWCVRSSRIDETGIDFFEVCDRTSQELCDVASLVWNSEENGYRDALELAVPNGDLLVPATIEIEPAHRGKGLGLLAVWRFLDYFGAGAAITVLKPHPLDPTSSEEELAPGVAKLKGHWSRLGFQPLPKQCSVGSLDATDYFFLDMHCKRPSLEDLLR